MIGVQGTGEAVGVWGGPSSDKVGSEIAAGVVGNAIGQVDAGDIPFSYGGWFDAMHGTAPLHLEPSASDAPPVSSRRGDLFVDNAGRLWFCVNDGNPAIWKQVQLI